MKVPTTPMTKVANKAKVGALDNFAGQPAGNQANEHDDKKTFISTGAWRYLEMARFGDLLGVVRVSARSQVLQRW